MNCDRSGSTLPAALLVAGLFIGCATSTDMSRVSGTVTYRERIAMPPGAVVELTLEDVSRMDAPAEVLGSATIEDPGNVPIAFEIPYDPDDVDERNSYSVRARILVGGRPRWVSASVNPVLTRGNDASVDILLTAAGDGTTETAPEDEADRVLRGMYRYMADAALFRDCRTDSVYQVQGDAAAELERGYLNARGEPGQELLVEIEGVFAMREGMEGGPRPTVLVRRVVGFTPRETCGNPMSTADFAETYWKLTWLGNHAVAVADSQREPHLVFRQATGRVEGSGGCNQFGGNYTVEGSNLEIEGTVSTMMACMEGMETEQAFFSALEAARSWRIEGEHLELYDAAGARLGRFEATYLD